MFDTILTCHVLCIMPTCFENDVGS